MKKTLVIVFLIITPILASGITFAESPQITEEPQSIVGVTFILGYILKPKVSEYNIVTGRALILFYHDRGVIFKDTGVITGLKKIRFHSTPLTVFSEPDAIGGVKVLGICTGLRVLS